MRQMSRAALAVAFMFVCLRPGMAQDVATSSASWLGDEKYTIHMAGTLADAVQDLGKLAERPIRLSTAGRGEAAPELDRDVPVVLDHDDATLHEILLDLCGQSGLVFESYGGRMIALRTGDMTLDSRPTARLPDYVVRISAATITSRSSSRFYWGEAESGGPTYSQQFALQFEVVPRSANARLHLAGVAATMKATIDEDTTLEVRSQGPGGMYPQYGPPDSPVFKTSVDLPLPPEGATSIARLEGALKLFAKVQTTEIRILPDSQGETLEKDGITVEVRTWERADDSLRVALQVHRPPLTTGRRTFPRPPDREVLVLVTSDGRKLGTNSFRASGSGDDRQLRGGFTLPRMNPPEIDHVRLTITRRAEPDKTIPFVIQNIPIPQ